MNRLPVLIRLITGFFILVILYFIGVFWNWLFLREGMPVLGFVIYFIGAVILFLKFIEILFEWLRTIVHLFKGINRDPLFNEAFEIISSADHASASLLQRRLEIKYERAAKIIAQLEKEKYISPAVGSLPRKILKEVQINHNYEKSV